MAAAVRVPVVGTGVFSGLLSSKNMFVRFAFSFDIMANLAGAIAHFMGLRSVGAVAHDSFRTVTESLATPSLNITSCGSFVYSADIFKSSFQQMMTGRLESLYAAGCRYGALE